MPYVVLYLINELLVSTNWEINSVFSKANHEFTPSLKGHPCPTFFVTPFDEGKRTSEACVAVGSWLRTLHLGNLQPLCMQRPEVFVDGLVSASGSDN